MILKELNIFHVWFEQEKFPKIMRKFSKSGEFSRKCRNTVINIHHWQLTLIMTTSIISQVGLLSISGNISSTRQRHTHVFLSYMHIKQYPDYGPWRYCNCYLLANCLCMKYMHKAAKTWSTNLHMYRLRNSESQKVGNRALVNSSLQLIWINEQILDSKSLTLWYLHQKFAIEPKIYLAQPQFSKILL